MDRADVDACAAIDADLFAGEQPWRREAFATELARGYHYLAATVYNAASAAGELAGYAGMALLGRPPHTEAEVHTIGVAREHQHRGIGRMLLRELLAHADAHGAATYLEVRTDNEAAIALYRSEGFEMLSTRRRYYQPSGADAYVMRRRAVSKASLR